MFTLKVFIDNYRGEFVYINKGAYNYTNTLQEALMFDTLDETQKFIKEHFLPSKEVYKTFWANVKETQHRDKPFCFKLVITEILENDIFTPMRNVIVK